MKLSEAIRLGCLLHPRQAFGHGTEFNAGGEIVATCALRAALFAGYTTPYSSADPFVLDASIPCPEGCGATTLGGIVTHLNDEHRWTREQIAAWVETVEAQDVQPQELAEVPR